VTQEHEPSVPPIAIVLLLPMTGAAVAFCVVSSLLWRREGPASWHTAWHAAALAVVSAALVGAPAAHWAIASGRRRIHHWMGLGAASGALLVLVPFIGHLIGAVLRGEMTVFRLTWGVLLRFILDTLGLEDLLHGGRALFVIETLPVITGALTGAIFWALAVRSHRRSADPS
jgi:hypothetical protein